jgi:hypothetical protein
MISIGGWDPTSVAEYATADPWTYGIGIFDLSALTWGESYEASKGDYERPDTVTSYYAAKLDTFFYPHYLFEKEGKLRKGKDC